MTIIRTRDASASKNGGLAGPLIGNSRKLQNKLHPIVKELFISCKVFWAGGRSLDQQYCGELTMCNIKLEPLTQLSSYMHYFTVSVATVLIPNMVLDLKGPLLSRDHVLSEQPQLLRLVLAKPNRRQKICI